MRINTAVVRPSSSGNHVWSFCRICGKSIGTIDQSMLANFQDKPFTYICRGCDEEITGDIPPLKSYIVYSDNGDALQFYAEDLAHAVEQAQDYGDEKTVWIPKLCPDHNATEKTRCTVCGALKYPVIPD